MVLREIPTRISLKTSPNDAVDALVDDDGDNDQTTTMTMMLPPTTLEGTAAPLPYQLELTRITAAIDRMKQRDTETPIHQNRLYPLSDKQSWPTVKLRHVESTQPSDKDPSDPTITATQALQDFLSQYPRPVDRIDNNNGNQLHEGRQLSTLVKLVAIIVVNAINWSGILGEKVLKCLGCSDCRVRWVFVTQLGWFHKVQFDRRP